MMMTRVRGFSLLELLIVMAIMAVAAGVAVPTWNRYVDNAALRAAAREIESDLKLLKQRARSDSSAAAYTMSINLATNQYTLTGSPGVKSPADFGEGVKLAKFGSQTNGAYSIKSLARGTYDPITGSITLENSRKSSAEIKFNVTGRTYVVFKLK